MAPWGVGVRPFIIGGGPSTGGAMPWAVRLTMSAGGQVYGECSGSLIGEQWVLTAAHCVTDINGPDPRAVVPGIAVVVAVGAEAVDSIRVYVHQAWDPATLRNDVALLELSRPVAARAVALGRSDQAGRATPGTAAVASGWGVVAPDAASGPGALFAVTLPVLSDAACQAAYPNGGADAAYDAATMMCAGLPAGGAGTCYGDSGGPLTVPDGHGGALLVGSTSWGGVPCATVGNPSVFARLPAYAAGVVALLAGAPEAAAGAPAALTGAAADAAGGAATLTGSVDPGGLATDYRIEIGPTTAYGSVVARGYAGAGHGGTAVAAPVSGLAPGSYHYRVVAESAAGVSAGADAVLGVGGAPATPFTQASTPVAAAAPPANAFRAETRATPCKHLRGTRRTACLRRQRRQAQRRACAKKPTARARARCRAAVLDPHPAPARARHAVTTRAHPRRAPARAG